MVIVSNYISLLKYNMSSYIINSFRVPKVVKEYLDILLIEYDNSTKQFFYHILNSSIIYVKRGEDGGQGWYPLPSTTIRKEWRKVNWQVLQAKGLLEVKILSEKYNQTYSRKQGICRKYRIPLTILKEIMHIYQIEDSTEYYNLMTGKKMNQFNRHKLTNENGSSIPPLVKKSIITIERCILNDKEVKGYLAEYYSQIKNDTQYRRYINDLNCYNKIKETGAKNIGKGLIEYYPSYHMQISGRISEQGGGMQSCTKIMKSIAFKNIPGVKNYDLKSSQVWGLIQWFEYAHLDISWLTEYLSKSKHEYAEKVGVTTDTWKSCFLALIMGAALYPSIDKEEVRESDAAIIVYLREELEEVSKVIDSYKKFYKLVAPLHKELLKWQDWLITEHLPIVTTTAKGRILVTNKTGAHFDLHPYKTEDDKWKDLPLLKRKLCAFFLQGNEAAFIHHLTWISKLYGYEVISNQFDGLVVIGEIPAAAIYTAKESSGLKYAILEEKPFL